MPPTIPGLATLPVLPISEVLPQLRQSLAQHHELVLEAPPGAGSYDEKITKRGTQASAILDGFGAKWLWRSAFITRVVRKRQLARIQLDRAATKLTGRDTTND